jgi:peptidoglycan hydrolase CwlO-like protein
MKLSDFLKKNWKYILLILLVILAVTWLSIREGVIKRQTKKIAELEFDNFRINNDRQNLDLQLKKLQNEYDLIENSNDSLKTVLNKKQKELKDLIEKHKQEIADLTNIPTDTVYLRLGLLYPNYDASPVKYPFSGSQIKPIYATAISLDMVKEEYILQGKNLNSCLELNTGYEKGIVNLNSQISNLQENIGKADSQIKNYNTEIGVLKKQVRKKGFWNKTLIITSGVLAGIAIIK